MRLLTFLQLAEETPEKSFAYLQAQLQLKPEQVEPFIIEGETLALVVCLFEVCVISVDEGVLVKVNGHYTGTSLGRGQFLSNVKKSNQQFLLFFYHISFLSEYILKQVYDGKARTPSALVA
jgi:hypothetical protein